MDKRPCIGCKPICLSIDDLKVNLLELDGWSFDEIKKVITKTYQFKKFTDAIDFVSRVADVAEEKEHHPDIIISYNKVTLSLSTHDLLCISDLDIVVAKNIDLGETKNIWN